MVAVVQCTRAAVEFSDAIVLFIPSLLLVSSVNVA
jgi:hypothetical protein